MLPNRLGLQLVGKMGEAVLAASDNCCLVSKVFLINGISNQCIDDEKALTNDVLMKHVACTRNL